MEQKSTKPFAKVVKRILEYRQSGTVLDVGTGEGTHALFLAAQGFDVTALDTTSDNFQKIEGAAAAQGFKVKTVVGNVLELNKLNAQFDIVICTSVLHFLAADEISLAMQQLKAATSNHGINVVSAHTVKNEGEIRAHLFEEGELQKYYADWKMLYEWEGLGGPFETKTGELIQRHRAEIIAESVQ
jgi:tellurite methyltransferase